MRMHICRSAWGLMICSLVLTTAAATAESDSPCPGVSVLVHGVMHYVDVEGGCWQFEDDSGHVYEPIGGPFYMYCDDFPGVLVGCLNPDLGSFCQVGSIVEVDDFTPDTFTKHGTVHFLDLAGGCWQFVADDDTPYEPIEGPPDMYENGRTGTMTAWPHCQLASFCQVGLIVQVTDFVADSADCSADLDASGEVGFNDLLILLAAWGRCPACAQDLDDDGAVGFADLLILLDAWGACA